MPCGAIREPTMEHAESTTRRGTRAALQAATLAALATLVGAVQAEGLTTRSLEGSYLSQPTAEYAPTNYRAPSNSIRLFGDYFFFDSTQGALAPSLGGFRASTGVVGLSTPLTLYETRPEAVQNLPYIGLGYSKLWFTGQLRLNADFGLASPSHGHGLFSSASALDEAASQLRWAPVMAVNLRYAF